MQEIIEQLNNDQLELKILCIDRGIYLDSYLFKMPEIVALSLIIIKFHFDADVIQLIGNIKYTAKFMVHLMYRVALNDFEEDTLLEYINNTAFDEFSNI